jgi:hypothetical protein
VELAAPVVAAEEEAFIADETNTEVGSTIIIVKVVE